MATTDVMPQESSGRLGQKHIVNDMSIQVATVNGSGSQSSNTVLLRSIFQMGVPVSGKQSVPSTLPVCRPGTQSAPTKTGTLRERRKLTS